MGVVWGTSGIGAFGASGKSGSGYVAPPRVAGDIILIVKTFSQRSLGFSAPG